MAPLITSKKRKGLEGDDSIHLDTESDEFGDGLLDGILSQSEDDTEEESDENADSEDEEAGDLEGFDDADTPPDDDDIFLDSHIALKGSNGLVGEELLQTEKLNSTQNDKDIPNCKVTTDANGGLRYEYKEIEPGYDSDDSDAPVTTNTIGNIPLSFYDSYPHIGYDINGKKIMRPAKGEALDALLDSIEVPEGWTGLTDPNTGKPLNLSQEELEMLRKIQMNEIPEEGFDPYPATVEYFTGIEEIMPLSAAPEPKRRFLPSKHEAKRVMKIVRAIREGRILPYKAPGEEEEEEEIQYDIWKDEQPRPEHTMNIPAPKLAPPGYDLSYNPPPEYLPSKAEKQAWESTDPEEREKEYLPSRYGSLRRVPAYDRFVKERFERSLDLYLAPRVRKNRLNIDPDSLLPKLPRPEELRPFPTACATLFRGHKGRVRSLAIDPSGVWLASGGDDGTIRVWELLTGRQLWSVGSRGGEAVNVVRWRPGKETVVLSAAAGDDVYLIVPPIVDAETEAASRAVLDAGFGHAKTASQARTADGKAAAEAAAQWARPERRLEDEGVLVAITTTRTTVTGISWHRGGNFLATVARTTQRGAVAVHTLSTHHTQLPFRRLAGAAQSVQFHPSRPVLFVATQRAIRSYDLARQELVQALQPGARWLSSLDVHPTGDHVIAGSYDRRLVWHDLDLAARPYKTLRFHAAAVRAVRFHPQAARVPLFADASDDGSLQIFHARVVAAAAAADLLHGPAIVPVKVLRGHRVRRALGVLDLDWHPAEPWCVSAGADGTCRLWM